MSPTPNDRDNPLKNWLPQTSLSALRHEIAEQMRSFWGDPISAMKGEMLPHVDVAETANSVEISMDLPGYRKDEIQVEVDEKTVTISGKHAEEQVDDSRKFHRLERRSGNFVRSVWLPCPVNQDQIEARLASGVLKVTLQKKCDSSRRKVDVQGE